ncbi:MAG: hypothetical protein ACLFVU_03255 [Phycisphaerae bacterium]
MGIVDFLKRLFAGNFDDSTNPYAAHPVAGTEQEAPPAGNRDLQELSLRHHLATGREATMTEQQLAGWDALEQMIRKQSAGV